MSRSHELAAPATKVLMIEDNPMDALVIKRMLDHEGGGQFVVVSAKTIKEGRACLRYQQVDLVLCDLSLPDSSGLRSFDIIQAEDPNLPVVVLSGTNDESVALKAVQHGAQDYLVKEQVIGQSNANLLLRSIRYAVERKRIEKALNYERDLLQTLQDNVPALIYFKDEQSRFLRVNRAWAARFGIAPSEAAGKTDFDFYSEKHARQAYEDELQIMRTGKSIINLVERETFADRPPRWALTSKLPLFDKAGKVIGTFGISSDITELKTAQDDLQQANEKLKTAQMQLIQAEKLQSIGRLAAGVAHEVKNPLAILKMCVDYVGSLKERSDPNLGQVLKDMNDAINRADTTVRSLLDYSADRDLEFVEQDLGEVIEEALTLVAHELSNGCVKLIKEFQSPMPPVRMDAEKIKQVLVNVFTNSIHAMSGQGELRVETRLKRMRPEDLTRDAGSRQAAHLHAGKEAAVIEVLDTGHGIPEEKLDKVFDPFFTTKPTGKGTGLGLTVTKKIIEMHGGQIQIKNREPKGVKVSIMLAL